jgi:signal peptidase I
MAEKEQDSELGETIRTIFFALVIAVTFRSFVFQPFNIPSESMVPTLLVGDYLFVSKFSYGYSRYSFPFGPPLFKGRIFESPVKRGDVVVFKLPRDGSTDYIKRVVGLPGDRIQVKDSVLYINDVPVKREAAADFILDDPNVNVHRSARYKETMANGASYMTLDLLGTIEKDNTQVYQVPPHYYFMMGDNRDNSLDSRFPSSEGVGFVPEENLIGKAELIAFSIDGSAAWWQFWRWIPSIRLDRLFKKIGP